MLVGIDPVDIVLVGKYLLDMFLIGIGRRPIDMKMCLKLGRMK